jgi:diacylglycerol kinase family enzyme
MRVHAIINRGAGGAAGYAAEELAGIAEAAFREAGHQIAVSLVAPAGVEAAFDEAVSESPGILIAGGGDGTVRSAASRLLGSEIALGILPLGTVNRLARDLHIPLEPRAALRALAGGGIRPIDVAEVNGEIFLCNSMLGLPSQISEERQNLRVRPLRERIAGYFKLLKTIVSSRRHLEVSIDGDANRRLRARVISLAVSNNLYRREPSLVFTRRALDEGKLGIYIAKPHSGLGMMWILARAALGLWSGDDRLDILSARNVTIGARRKRLRLSNDGEVETLKTPLRYQIHPKALKVLAPTGRSE